MPRAKRARHRGPETAPQTGPEAGVASSATPDSGQAKQVPARRNLRGRRGGLKDMPNMPLDILIEIFGHMHPRDLLNLARTTKDFREFLMSRNASRLWKAARRQVEGLPDCPEHLSEPAYVNLVFFSHCHGCLKPNVKNTLWEFGVRYCPSCKEKLVTNGYYGIVFIGDVLERTSVNQGFLNNVQAPYTKGSRFKDTYYHVVEIREFREKWDSLSTDDERKAFVTERVEAVKSRKEHAHRMSEWQKRQEESRSNELDAIRDRRLADIRERLREDGWAKELAFMDDLEEYEFSQHKSVRKSQKLTPYGWLKICEGLHRYMANIRTKRLARERLDMTCARLGLLREALLDYGAARLPISADMDWKPLFADYALMPPFRDVMEASADTEVIKDVLLELCEAHMPAQEAQWREDRKREFAALVRGGADTVPGLALPEDDDTLLSLAIASFDCKNCSYRGNRWPQVLAHRCVRTVSFLEFYFGGADAYRQAISRACFEHKEPPPWPQDKSFSFCSAALERLVAVITACGKDPAAATFEEMEACEVRLLCRPCTNLTTGCMVFDWKNGARHGRLFPLVEERHAPEWVHLGVEHAKRVAQLEVSRRARHDAAALTRLSTKFGCTKCRYRGELVQYRGHCKEAHDVEDPQLGTHYYRHTDNLPYAVTPIRIYPEAQSEDIGVADLVQSGNGFVISVPVL